MEHFKLLIIGAGASGIAAAARLLESGFSNFRIIEAESRIGGRICTTSIDESVPVELGAEWIHGETGNVVYELASKYNLADNSSDVCFNQTKFFDFSGCQISKEISLALTTTFNDIMNTSEKNLDDKTLNGSIGSYFEVEFQNSISDLKKELNIDDKLCQKFLKTFENWENSIDGSHSWYETSLKGHLDYWECPGNLITRWKNNSYHTLFHLLTKTLDLSKGLPVNDKIFFNKEVSQIKWNKECKLNVPNAEVFCSDGTVYLADHVLVTCSLGVLKHNSEMFCPALPEEKLSCIQNLGYGTVDKIFLKFSHPWWKDDFDGFAFLWSEDERKNDSSGWLNGVICFHPINTDCAVLRGWITGKEAEHMETLPNHEIIQGLNYLFDKFLGSSYFIPSIEVCLVSKWYMNPHFRGSYSLRILKSEEANVWASQLAEPVCNVKGIPILFFGGEASHDHYFSTTHGAVEAGVREANKLLPLVMRVAKKLKKNYQIAIVGAGISGLAAAKTLFENGMTDFIILEAQVKPGGRISSIKFEDFYLELGAQWIHGEKNEVFNICKENDLLTDNYSSEGEGLYLRENGEVIEESIIREVDDVVKDILEECETFISGSFVKNGPHSIGQELTTKFNDYLESCCEDTVEVKEIKRDLLDWHKRFQLIDNSCSDLYNLSAKAWGQFKFCGGNDHINFKNGYSTLIDTLLNCVPEKSILCETPVRRIDWAEDIKTTEINGADSEASNHCVKITCENELTFFTQHIIVTSSLGCLKSNHKTMFSPPLPNYLTEAIEKLDFGVLNKIFLIYDQPWWDEEVKGFQLIWSQKNFNPLDDERNHWGKYLTGFDVIIKNKPILLGWIGGEGAKMVEKMSEEELGRDATELLQKFCKKSFVPIPKKVIRSTWWSNEYVKGGYSHITVKCDELKINGSNLSQPVYSIIHGPEGTYKKPTILLAGESTHKNYFSTVHGAYESGQSQAHVILKYLQGEKS